MREEGYKRPKKKEKAAHTLLKEMNDSGQLDVSWGSLDISFRYGFIPGL